MESKFPKMQPIKSKYLLLELLVELFTVGIFSVEGGVKAWFEFILVVAALCACGYVLWWQIPLLLLVVILSPIAAGLFCLTLPEYMDSRNLTASDQVTSVLKIISTYNLNEIPTLSGTTLNKRLEQFLEAKKIFEDNPQIFEQIYILQSIFDDINHAYNIADEMVAEENREIKKQHQRDEDRRKREQAEQRRKEHEIYQTRLKEEAIRNEQEKIRQKATEKENQEASERKRQQTAWITEERRKAKYTGGCPPDSNSGEARCPPGYPVKVTLYKKEDGYDGIIWHPSDGKQYETTKPQWCYQSIQESESERGQYRFRRPKKRCKN